MSSPSPGVQIGPNMEPGQRIREVIVTTCSTAGRVHIAPMGIREADGITLIAPFRPSATLDNIEATRVAVVNFVEDVRVFAGCISGRQRDWPTRPASTIPGAVLMQALAHRELELRRTEADEQRPRLHLECVHEQTHANFAGFNRAQSAVLEAAILVSRLGMLTDEKIDNELAYLQIAIDKTAGDEEREAWSWLEDAIRAYRTRR